MSSIIHLSIGCCRLHFDKPSDNTWEPWENICNCRELLQLFEEEVKRRKGSSHYLVGGKRPRGSIQQTVVGSGALLRLCIGLVVHQLLSSRC